MQRNVAMDAFRLELYRIIKRYVPVPVENHALALIGAFEEAASAIGELKPGGIAEVYCLKMTGKVGTGSYLETQN